MNYKEQIAEFYKRKGLTGKRLRRAVLNDTIRAKHYAKRQHHSGSKRPLISMFEWDSTPEGVRYWADRSIGVVTQRRSEVWV